jgi:hypothetical protein
LPDAEIMPVSKGRKKAKEVLPSRPSEQPKLCYVLLLATCNLLRRLGTAIGYSWRVLIGLSVVVTILAGGAFFLPHLTVEPTEPIIDDVSVPSPITFKIHNTGIIPLWEAQPFLGVCSLEMNVGPYKQPKFPASTKEPTPQTQCPGSLYGGKIGSDKWPPTALEIDKYFDIALQDFFYIGTQVIRYDVAIIVNYQPWFIPWPRHKEFRYDTRVLADGKLRWFAR